jgi:hypothetical protein
MHHPRTTTLTGRTGLAAVLAAVAVALAACSSQPAQTTTQATGQAPQTSGSPSTSSRSSDTTERRGTGTTEAGDGPTETTARRSTTTGGGGGTTEGACALLTEDEVQEASGKEVARVGVLRGEGCFWNDENGGSLVDIEVESSSSFDTEKQLYADPDAQSLVDGIGEDAYYSGLNDWVVFKREGKAYEVRLQQPADDAREQELVIELARKADARI